MGSGKTATLVVEGIALSLQYPGNVGLIARKTLPELKSTTLKRFFEFLPDPLILSYNKTDRELLIRTNGKPSLVHFGPCDEINRYKSLELGWFGLDEADEISEDHWLTLCGRLRMKDIPQFGMLATNPTSPNHWIFRKWMKEPLEGYEIFRSKTSDNAANLPPDYEENLRKTYSSDWVDRFVGGQFGVLQSGDPCFPDFEMSVHALPQEPDKSLPLIRGWDFGRRRPCVVFAQMDKEGRFKILRTLLGENEDIYEFSERVIKYSNQNFNIWKFDDYCDPAGKHERDSGKPSVKVLNEKGIFPRFRMSTPDQRATHMRKMMRGTIKGEPEFQVDPVNTYLIEAFMGGYQIDDSGKPRKDGYYEHGIDALGYIICNTCMVSSRMVELDVDIPEPRWSYGGGQWR